MQKKYFLWIVIGIILIVTAFLLAVRNSEAPVAPVPLSAENTNSIETAIEDVDLEDLTVDFEKDADEVDINKEVYEEFDTDDFDVDTIDEDAF